MQELTPTYDYSMLPVSRSATDHHEHYYNELSRNYALLCSALLRNDLLSYDLLCYASLCLAMLGFAMPCNAFLCFRFILNLARLPLQDEPENAINSYNLCNHLTPMAIPLKFLEKMSFFTQNRKFLEKMPFSDPFVGGTTAGPKKVKNYKQNITENHNKKSREDFLIFFR